MKVLKKRFGMTKEEVDGNIRLLSYHKAYINMMAEVEQIKARKDIPLPEKLRKIRVLKKTLHKEWKDK